MGKTETLRRRRSTSRAPTLAKESSIFKSNRRERNKSPKSVPRKIPRNNSAITDALKREPFLVSFLSFAYQLFMEKLRRKRTSTPDEEHSKSRSRSRPHHRRKRSGGEASQTARNGRNNSKHASNARNTDPDPTLRARIPKRVLEGGEHGPFRPPFLKRVAMHFQPKTSVKIESREGAGLSTSVLYAPEVISSNSQYPFAKTQLVSGCPSRNERNLVYQDSPFEIRVAGMLVRKFDKSFPGPSADNELLMYSVQTDPSTSGDTNESLPFIHFDHYRDGNKFSERPNTYVPIPASKSFVMGSQGTRRGSIRRFREAGSMSAQSMSKNESMQKGATYEKSEKSIRNSKERKQALMMTNSADVQKSQMMNSTSEFAWDNPETKKSVNVQFKILELDQPNETTKQAITGVDQLSGFVSGFATAAPFLGVLTPALSLAGAVSKRVLNSYAKPDKVLSIDMDFRLADRYRVRSGRAPPGEYLRYGYYFFLAEPVEGKLYASVQTPKNVQLMMHRRKGDRRAKRSFFPLTEISYLVVRVSEPTFSGNPNRRPIQMRHANQLEEIFKTARTDDPKKVQDAVNRLGTELGVTVPAK